jgi:hypothetical protein
MSIVPSPAKQKILLASSFGSLKPADQRADNERARHSADDYPVMDH